MRTLFCGCSLCTHAFMAIRIWKLTSRNIPIIAVIALCLLAALTGGLWATVIVGTYLVGQHSDGGYAFDNDQMLPV
jgi:hypothetical protein